MICSLLFLLQRSSFPASAHMAGLTRCSAPGLGCYFLCQSSLVFLSPFCLHGFQASQTRLCITVTLEDFLGYRSLCRPQTYGSKNAETHTQESDSPAIKTSSVQQPLEMLHLVSVVLPAEQAEGVTWSPLTLSSLGYHQPSRNL